MIPSTLINGLQQINGFNEASFLQAHQQVAPVSIRFNTLKSFNNQYLLPTIQQPVPWCNQAVYLKERPSFVFDPIWHAGGYYVQEASSMFVQHILSQLLDNNTQKMVLDLCAAPGGKTTLLSNFFKDGLLVSNEVIKTRVNILEENVTKWGTDNVVVTNNDPKHFEALPNFFDVVVVDAPCSGSGLFRKDANAINEWSEANVKLCSERQQRILNHIKKAVADNGYLIYSTCSYSQQENEDIIDFILQDECFETVDITVNEGWGIVKTSSLKHNGIGYRFFPHLLQGEGFFIAVFKKTVTDDKTQKLAEKKLTLATKNEQQIVASVIGNASNYQLMMHEKTAKLIPASFLKNIQILAAHLYIKQLGITVGEFAKNSIIPHHHLSMSHLPLHQYNKIALTKEQAIQYLKRNDIEVQQATPGWHIVQYCELNLGFVKVLPNRVNNYYPKEWRILKDYI